MYGQNCLNSLLFTKPKCACFQIETSSSNIKIKTLFEEAYNRLLEITSRRGLGKFK